MRLPSNPRTGNPCRYLVVWYEDRSIDRVPFPMSLVVRWRLGLELRSPKPPPPARVRCAGRPVPPRGTTRAGSGQLSRLPCPVPRPASRHMIPPGCRAHVEPWSPFQISTARPRRHSFLGYLPLVRIRSGSSRAASSGAADRRSSLGTTAASGGLSAPPSACGLPDGPAPAL